MKPFPFPVRLAAGVAMTAVERAREMPKQLTGLPVTVVSQMLQASMRVQQNITELAIKGDDALAGLRPVEEAPSWATFDEDVAETSEREPSSSAVTHLQPVAGNGRPRELPDESAFDNDPWAQEERALAQDYAEGTFDSPAEEAAPPAASSAPAGVADYDQLSLPQLRARLRRFSAQELEQLLAHERAHANRSSFTGMLARRIDNVRKEGGAAPGQDTSER